MKLSEEMSRQCLFATDGTKLSGLFQFRIRFYGLASLPTFQGKIHRTVEYSTPAWMNDIIVVTRGSKQGHEQKLFEVLSKFRNTGYRLGKRKSKFFLKHMKWLVHEIDENGTKPNEEKEEATLKLKKPNHAKELKTFSMQSNF